MILFTLSNFAQEYADKAFYLVDSLSLKELSNDDQALLDEYLNIYHSSKEDSVGIWALNEICSNLNNDVWVKYQFYLLKKIQQKIKSKPKSTSQRYLLLTLSDAYNNLGYIYNTYGDNHQALEYFRQAIEVQKELNDKKGIAISFNNIGAIYNNLGSIDKTLEYNHLSLKVREEINDQEGVAISLSNIGLIYNNQHDYENAFKYYQKAFDIWEKLNNKKGMSLSYKSLGDMYLRGNDLDKAYMYFQKSVQMREEIGDELGIASSLTGLAVVAEIQRDTVLALDYYLRSYALREKQDFKEGMSSSLISIGQIQFLTGDFKEAETSALNSLKIAKEIGYPANIRGASKLLSDIYDKKGQYEKSLEMYKLHILMRDSINNEETQKATIRQQTQYEFEKEQIRKENEAKEQARVEAEQLKRRDNMEYSLIFLGILLFFGIVLMLGFVKVSPNVAEGLIFFAFLIFFEFVLVFVEPYLNNITEGEPIYTLLANAGIALLIFPLHDKLEELLKKRIVK